MITWSPIRWRGLLRVKEVEDGARVRRRGGEGRGGEAREEAGSRLAFSANS